MYRINIIKNIKIYFGNFFRFRLYLNYNNVYFLVYFMFLWYFYTSCEIINAAFLI